MYILQYIIVGLIALGAIVYLLKKYAFPAKDQGCGDGDCGCH